MKNIKGFVNSIQSLGTVDGPGVRFVLFMQGCNLRCGCCHNPETQKKEGGDEYSPDELIKKIVRYKAYFGNDGGVTLSGGEPLLQAEFARELFMLCHENAINTCLDTSGSILNDNIKLLLEHTDRVLLDIKYTDDELYKEHAGCSLAAPLEFLSFLDSKKIPTTIRQVIIPDLNDDDGNIRSLCSIIKAHSCVDSFELLPFKKLCIAKYEKYGMDFKFKNIPEPDEAVMERLNSLMMSCL